MFAELSLGLANDPLKVAQLRFVGFGKYGLVGDGCLIKQHHDLAIGRL